jgi:hypothetical protein
VAQESLPGLMAGAPVVGAVVDGRVEAEPVDWQRTVSGPPAIRTTRVPSNAASWPAAQPTPPTAAETTTAVREFTDVDAFRMCAIPSAGVPV